MPHSFLSLSDLKPAENLAIIDRAIELSRLSTLSKTLTHKVIGVFFRKTSTRTRTAFTTATIRLGGDVVTFAPNDLQLCTGETLEDTGRVLSGYLDALIVRSGGSVQELRILGQTGNLPIVNAMAAEEHPTQGICDFAAMKAHFGGLDGLQLLYVGEGNNTAAALALLTSQTRGVHSTFLTPTGYGLCPEVKEQAAQFSSQYGGSIKEIHEVAAAPGDVDVVYTTRWQTTGTTKGDPNWRSHFSGFCVTTELMQSVSHSDTVFMHDLPAVRGEDCEGAVLDGPRSIAFDQAKMKLHSAMAVLEWCTSYE